MPDYPLAERLAITARHLEASRELERARLEAQEKKTDEARLRLRLADAEFKAADALLAEYVRTYVPENSDD